MPKGMRWASTPGLRGAARMYGTTKKAGPVTGWGQREGGVTERAKPVRGPHGKHYVSTRMGV